jgi:integrase
MSKILEKLKSIKVIRSRDPYRPTLKLNDLECLLKINETLSTTDDSKKLNTILLLTAFYTALRISELINLELRNVYLSENKILVLNGKHGKNRPVGINKELKPGLENYIFNERPQTNSKKLFVLPCGSELTRDRASKRIKILTKKAGLAGGFHQFRRGCLTHFANKGVPVPHLQVIAGHQSIDTTMKYIRPDEQEIISNQINW